MPAQETKKAIPSTNKPLGRTPDAAALKSKKDALERGERTPSRVFRIEKKPDGTFSRVEVNPETRRRKSAKAWEAKSEVAKVRQSLDLTQDEALDSLRKSILLLLVDRREDARTRLGGGETSLA